MEISQIPTKFPIPFANSAGASYIRPIPEASQIGIQAGAASLTDGFPPVTFSPISAGGVPPFGQDFNGLLYQVTAWSQWQCAGATVQYDAVFSGDVGGYPQGALLSGAAPGVLWVSTVDNNTTDPDTGGAGWVQSGLPAGAVQDFLLAAAPAGWLEANGGTIGSASSGSTLRANADTVALFTAMWNLSASVSPIFTSSGASSSRGASASADFAANKRITVPDMRGIFRRGLDDGRGVDSGRVLGSQQADAFKSHTHTANVTDPGHHHGVQSESLDINFSGNPATYGVAGFPFNGLITSTDVTGITVANTSTGGTETRPINIALLTCIKL